MHAKGRGKAVWEPRETLDTHKVVRTEYEASRNGGSVLRSPAFTKHDIERDPPTPTLSPLKSVNAHRGVESTGNRTDTDAMAED